MKKLCSSKERLSTVFTPQERRSFTLAMLEDVITAIQTSAVDQIVVAGEDLDVQRTAERHGAAYMPAEGATLNSAIAAADVWCRKKGATSVLVLPADVPLLDAKDVDRILKLGSGGGSAVVLSPSQNWGTNALYQNPASLILPCFGSKSFLSHIQEAFSRGISVRLHFSESLALDIDSAYDLKELLQINNSISSIQILKTIIRENNSARAFFQQKMSKEKEEG